MRRSKVLAMWCCGVALSAALAGAQRYALKPLSGQETRSAQAGLDMSLLPEGAKGLQLARGQVFRVDAAGRTEVTVLPVRFYTAAPGLVQGIDRRSDLCGVFLSGAGAKARFEPLADNDTDGSVQCGGVEGVGLARGTGTHPEVLLLFRVHTMHRSWSDPYAVQWSSNDGRYVLEHLAAPAGVRAGDKLTIAELRCWVSAGK